MQGGQPQVFIAGVVFHKVEVEGRAQALQGIGARVHFAAFDTLDGTCADFAFFGDSSNFRDLLNLESKTPRWRPGSGKLDGSGMTHLPQADLTA